jgi:hypothetical protein
MKDKIEKMYLRNSRSIQTDKCIRRTLSIYPYIT